MFDFDKELADLRGQTVLCIGDLMLDDFVYGEVARISPEAPAPVIAVQRSETTIGGAGNVARNLAALGVRCIFVGVIGEDDAGKVLSASLQREPLIEAKLVSDASRPTTRKVRSPVWEKVTVPFLSTANWGGQGLHPRGNFEGFVRAASKEKWLEAHGIE